MCIRDRFIILHAGTYKRFGSRPWIYENSNEYLKSLQLLIHGISKFQNVELIIRVREEPVECDMKALQELLPKVNNWQFSKELKFENDLYKSDLLISFSSTTIEEALRAKVPVGLFSLSSRYRHINNPKSDFTTTRRNPIYHLNKESLHHDLTKIIQFHKNRRLTSDEISSFVWGDDAINNSELINQILNFKK